LIAVGEALPGSVVECGMEGGEAGARPHYLLGIGEPALEQSGHFVGARLKVRGDVPQVVQEQEAPGPHGACEAHQQDNPGSRGSGHAGAGGLHSFCRVAAPRRPGAGTTLVYRNPAPPLSV